MRIENTLFVLCVVDCVVLTHRRGIGIGIGIGIDIGLGIDIGIDIGIDPHLQFTYAAIYTTNINNKCMCTMLN